MRGSYEIVNRRDFELAHAAQDPEVMISYAPDPAARMPPDLIGEFRGEAGFRHAWQARLDAFEDLRLEPDEVTDLGEGRLLVALRAVGRGTASGVVTDQRGFTLYTFRGGRVVRHESSSTETRPNGPLASVGAMARKRVSRLRPIRSARFLGHCDRLAGGRLVIATDADREPAPSPRRGDCIRAEPSVFAADPRIPADVGEQVEISLGGDVSFVASDEVRDGATDAGLDSETVDALVENYEDAQLDALKTAFLFAAFIVLASFWATRRLPTRLFEELESGTDPPQAGAPAPR